MSESSTIPPTPPSVGLHPELAAAAASVAEVTEHLRFEPGMVQTLHLHTAQIEGIVAVVGYLVGGA